MNDANINRRNVFFLLLFLLAVGLTSCASAQFEGKATLLGRVCDERGKPVPNYHVSLGGGRETLTDSGGMFVFREVAAGSYHLYGGGNGWESFSENLDFYDRKMVACVQVKSLEEVLSEIDALFFTGDVAEAKKLLEKSEKYNEKNPLFRCVRDLLSYWEMPSEKSRERFFSSLEKM